MPNNNKLINTFIIVFTLAACDTDIDTDVSEAQTADQLETSLESELEETEIEERSAKDCGVRCCDGSLFQPGSMGEAACADQGYLCHNHWGYDRIRWGGEIIRNRPCW
jgi:hypothetical protein